MQPKANALLKISGILMIIGAVITIIVGILAVIGVAALSVGLLGSTEGMGLVFGSLILSVITGIVQLVAGILGVKNAAKYEKADICIIFGVAVILLSLVGTAMSIVGGNDFQITSVVTGLLVPILYVVGAFQNRARAY